VEITAAILSQDSKRVAPILGMVWGDAGSGPCS
jgi:hypothetical protein